jgi:hypothetical protein
MSIHRALQLLLQLFDAAAATIRRMTPITVIVVFKAPCLRHHFVYLFCEFSRDWKLVAEQIPRMGINTPAQPFDR